MIWLIMLVCLIFALAARQLSAWLIVLAGGLTGALFGGGFGFAVGGAVTAFGYALLKRDD